MQELLFQYIIPFENRPKSQHEENNMTQNQTEWKLYDSKVNRKKILWLKSQQNEKKYDSKFKSKKHFMTQNSRARKILWLKIQEQKNYMTQNSSK